MVIKFSNLKEFLWGLIIITMALSFPLQVYAGNPYPSLLPYILVGFVFLITGSSYRTMRLSKKIMMPSNHIGLMIRIYLLLVFTQTVILSLFGLISINEALSTFVIYVLPVFFYLYFRQLGTEKEIKVVMVMIIISSLIIGVYFAYESYIKLSQFKLTDYAIKAFDYSQIRTENQFGDLNKARITIGFRSYGLMESHSVSGAWIIIGAIASLALCNENKKKFRFFIIIIYAIFLLIGLNFTSIIAYLFIIFFIEFNGMSLFRLRISVKFIQNSIISIFLFYIFLETSSYILGEKMADFISKNLVDQKEVALGGLGGLNTSYLEIILNNIRGYFNHILMIPHSLLIGDGFSSFGLKKGGDIGFIESLAKFGLPYFTVLIYGIYVLISRSLKEIRSFKVGAISEWGMNLVGLQFAASFMILIFISDIHYSIWVSKSILPVFFFSLALFDRYLNGLPKKKINV